jgi:hypothetical protein
MKSVSCFRGSIFLLASLASLAVHPPLPFICDFPFPLSPSPLGVLGGSIQTFVSWCPFGFAQGMLCGKLRLTNTHDERTG